MVVLAVAGHSLAAELEGTDLSNLYEAIDRDAVHGLNLTVPEDAKAIIKPWNERDDTTRYIESSVDDEVIIHVPFTQSVRVKAILLKIGRGEYAPRRMRVYANHPNIVGFEDVESTKSQLNIALLEGETGVVEYPVRVASLTSISSLTLYFSHTVGGEQVRMYYVGFKGDVKTPRPEATQKIEIPAANAGDAPVVDKAAERAAARQSTAR
ncbi:DUF1000-domain-containing protein [Coniophora puteana RWD-64-598 SS2]|uniref:DUF1000-domain-containing protein n=1 Tax=Coniophora puteana (strain RWD-64-598) TaxID=741705 RepID=A0A5M3MHF4_CONPW|nr:DUF1000-domain-containing protein [Coniophora puteana RWD-64-598 SS2]EIW78487.1 DUF1000-domain-containing protein [Coniophora puteana RWD-64-598 SS2]